jgi:hypothetical protein
MCDAFEFIEGGKTGTMKRFGESIHKCIQTLGIENAAELAACLDISVDQLILIPKSPALFCSDIIEGCATAFQLDLRKCFKRSSSLTPDKEAELQTCVRQWGPRFAAGANSSKPSDGDYIDLFLLTRALQQLDAQTV